MEKNIVIIMADQLRKDCLGAYGNSFVKTPNLDRLAAMSVQFNRSYVANPICCPNRMSIFSGQYPSNHGLWTNGLLGCDSQQLLPHLLHRAGYQTASIGKLHFSPYSTESAAYSLESTQRWEDDPSAQDHCNHYFGFDYVELTLGHKLPKAHYYRWFRENGGTDDMLTYRCIGPNYGADEICGIRNMPSRLSSSAFVGERSVHYLRSIRDRSKPFFLSVGFPDPHHPFTSCEDDYQRWQDAPIQAPIGSSDDLEGRPPHYRQHAQGAWSRGGSVPPAYPQGIPPEVAEARVRHTYAMIESIDFNIGKLLGELEAEGLMKDTVIFFLSDHGELLGDHGLWLKGPFFYEGLINTPLLICHPEIAPRVSDALVSSVDLLPTLCDIADLPIPACTDGVSQWGHLQDRQLSPRSCCLIEYRNGYQCDVNVNALVTADYKFVQYETGEQEYTDLKNDPTERVNLAADASCAHQVCAATTRLLVQRLAAKSKGAIQYGHA